MPMIAALIHDLLITLGIYAITGREVTSATVAAVLTVLGYSLYDTIIVFDRVRENTPLLRKNSFAQIVNVSLWETLTRSINTSLITLVPILSLLLFGGSTLKDFAFALLIGIASGAYSSIFVAAPLLSMWKESEPEYKKRKGALAPVQKATLGLVDVPGAHHHKARTLDPTGLATVPEAEPVADDGVEAEPEPAEVGAGARSGASDGELSDSERAARDAARRRRQQRRGKGGGGGSRPPHRAR
jgi:SecD/SecF fusion protein